MIANFLYDHLGETLVCVLSAVSMGGLAYVWWASRQDKKRRKR